MTVATSIPLLVLSASIHSVLALPQAPAAPAAPPTLSIIPPMPAAWPATDEGGPITGAFLQEPLVTEALAYVNAVVPPQYLNIAPSRYTGPCTTVYPADAAVKNCYWPNNLCVRLADTDGFKADVTACPGENSWGLTYDDGPTVNIVNGVNTNDTPALRARLNAMNTKATFFIVGANGIQNPTQLAATVQEGHEMAIHTWTHYPATSLSNAQIIAELKYTEAMIYNATGVLPRFWRPPCGDIDDRVRAIASALGFTAVMWGTTPVRDTGDAAVPDNQQNAAGITGVVNTVKSWFTPQPGFISLAHDINPFTTGSAIASLDAIAAAGAAFPLSVGPVGTCLGQPSYKPLPERPPAPVPAVAPVAAIRFAGVDESVPHPDGFPLTFSAAETLKATILSFVSAALGALIMLE